MKEMNGTKANLVLAAALALTLALAFSPALANAVFNVTAVQTSLESDFRISDWQQAPDRVFPGDEVNLKMSLSTVRTEGVSDVLTTVLTPFDEITSTTKIDHLSYNEKKTISRVFTVPVGTKPGTYLIYVYASASSIPQQEVARIPLIVSEPSVRDLLLAQAAYNESVHTGDSTTISINLTNTGVLDAEDVYVQLVLNASGPFTPLEYDRKYVKKIKADETIQVPFLVGVEADASPGFYSLTVSIRYSVDKAVQPTIQQNLGLKVEANQELLVTSDFGTGTASTSGTAGASGGTLLTLTVANVGDTAVRGVYVKASSDYYRIIGASDKFIGTLNLDDSSTMSLTLVPRGASAAGGAAFGGRGNATLGGAGSEPTVTVLVSYKDPLNQERVIKQVIPLQVDSLAGGASGTQASASGQRFVRPQQNQGFLGISWIYWGGGAAVLVVLVAFWWFKKRKKKQKQEKQEQEEAKKKAGLKRVA
jgi:uncharacterized membrane protein